MDYLEFKSLSHHGIKGQRWGIRRFQNEDGSLTDAGKKKYSTSEIKEARKKDKVLVDKLASARKAEKDFEEQKSKDYDSGKKVYDSRYDYPKPTKKYMKKEDELYEARRLVEREYMSNKKISELKTPSETVQEIIGGILTVAGMIFVSDFIMDHSELSHHGIKGQRWGIRRFQNEDGSLTPKGKKRELTDQEKSDRNKNIRRTVGTAVAGAAIGAAVVGAAWYAKNVRTKKIFQQKRALSTAKAKATRAARKASGYYETFKNVDVLISKGDQFVKSFTNVSVAKILT